ncbi:Fur family transcriptional regulator [Carboxylicivirga taeanensis]|uniref:Fur family transcriptional regulator n=1 Tax=Carboxylicivirga taeanensis TaxID=1416875 RepID=UPI003F6DA8CF
MKTDESIKDYLRQRSLKATPIRVELLRLLSQNEAALPYSGIQSHLKKFDRVTLYRTINALIDNGIVHKASTSGDETYYALCNRQCSRHCHNHEHIHFICTHCQEVSCIHIEQSINISLPEFQIEEVSVEVSGICKKCLQGE